MVRVELTAHLCRFFPDLRPTDVSAAPVAEAIRALDRRYPGLARYVLDDDGSLRRHVNVFVGRRAVEDRTALSDPLGADDVVYVFQALSGG